MASKMEYLVFFIVYICAKIDTKHGEMIENKDFYAFFDNFQERNDTVT